MILHMVFSATLCLPATLPAPAERTAAFWDQYLNGMLNDCYGHLAPAVRETPVFVSPTARMTGSVLNVLEHGTRTELLVEPDLLVWAPSPEHIAVAIGHEAVHIGIFGELGLNAMPEAEEEAVADVVAATSVPQGACLLVQTYQWHLTRLGPSGDAKLTARIGRLQPLCIAQRTLR